MLKTLVLAAGKGSRLKSKTAKVLHKVFDKPILAWVLDSLAEVSSDEIVVITGHKASDVESFVHAYPVTTVRQEPQLGTGHAIQCAAEQCLRGYEGQVLVINGDSPLIKPETLNEMIDYHHSVKSDLTVLAAELNDPTGYGRLIRKNDYIIGIKEEKDCSEPERSIKEVNAGVYLFDWKKIKAGLTSLRNNNAQEEFYLTDLVQWAYSQALNISSYRLENADEMIGVNSRQDLAKVSKLKNEQHLDYLMANGVSIIDPESTYISPDAEVGADSTIYPGTYIQRRVLIGENCIIGPNTSIFGPAEIGNNSSVIQSHIYRSSLAENCQVGPFAHLRDGNDIGSNVKLGSFVEIKNCEIANNVSAAHLSYLGDSKIKSGVNIGAGTVTANYDSRTGEKNQTIINKNASTGSNSVLVAPVQIGENSLVAAGSVITEDVADNSLAIARPRQETKLMTVKQ